MFYCLQVIKIFLNLTASHTKKHTHVSQVWAGDHQFEASILEVGLKEKSVF